MNDESKKIFDQCKEVIRSKKGKFKISTKVRKKLVEAGQTKLDILNADKLDATRWKDSLEE